MLPLFSYATIYRESYWINLVVCFLLETNDDVLISAILIIFYQSICFCNFRKILILFT